VYVEATITEVFRVVSIVPFAVPKSATRDTQVGGYDIAKDTVVLFNLHSICYEKEFWGDPETFRPERFITDDGKLDQASCSRVLTFGIGRRRCVGELFAKMELFILFSTLMQRCEFRKPASIEYDLTPVPGLVYSPKEFLVVVKER